MHKTNCAVMLRKSQEILLPGGFFGGDINGGQFPSPRVPCLAGLCQTRPLPTMTNLMWPYPCSPVLISPCQAIPGRIAPRPDKIKNLFRQCLQVSATFPFTAPTDLLFL